MLTDDQARTLLHRAADTIEVAPARPIRVPDRRPPWVPGLAIAAALAVAAATTGIVVDRSRPADHILPSNHRTLARALWPAPSDPNQFRLAPDQMPSLFGYTAAAATTLLEQHGIAVTVRKEPVCGVTGRVESTKPAVGSVLTRADGKPHVTLLVGGPGAKCLYLGAGEGLAYRFLDWINGRGPAPDFARKVDLYVRVRGPLGHQRYEKAATFSGGGADVLANWGTRLDRLRDLSRGVWVDAGTRPLAYAATTLTATADERSFGPTQPAQRFTLHRPASADFSFQALAHVTFSFGRDTSPDPQGITALYIDQPALSHGPASRPQVVGDTLAFAKRRLTERAYAVATPGCRDDAIVTGQHLAARPQSDRGPVTIVLTCRS